jgi:hypothetical protein
MHWTLGRFAVDVEKNKLQKHLHEPHAVSHCSDWQRGRDGAGCRLELLGRSPISNRQVRGRTGAHHSQHHLGREEEEEPAVADVASSRRRR